MESKVFRVEDTVKVKLPGEAQRVGEIVEVYNDDLFKVSVGQHEVIAFADELERCETENKLEEEPA